MEYVELTLERDVMYIFMRNLCLKVGFDRLSVPNMYKKSLKRTLFSERWDASISSQVA